VSMQKPVEEAALRLYPSNKPAAARLLENYSKGVYISCLEAMNTLVSKK
jgi:hypothetical protein